MARYSYHTFATLRDLTEWLNLDENREPVYIKPLPGYLEVLVQTTPVVKVSPSVSIPQKKAAK